MNVYQPETRYRHCQLSLENGSVDEKSARTGLESVTVYAVHGID